jgi:hypothetical protein
MVKFPKVDSEFFPIEGGLDMVTPAISMPPGRAFDAQNYEPDTVGGYRRIDGYERFDGRDSPTRVATYVLLPALLTTRPADGSTLVGALSGATGRVLKVDGAQVVLGRSSGTFQLDENLNVNGIRVGVVTASQTVTSDPKADADYMLLAVNDLRNDIQQVPGSGPIRGVWMLNDVLYVFRDNLSGNAGLIYKATSSGWQAVSMGWHMKFRAGTSQINPGDVIANAASSPTITATVTTVLLRSGSWSGGTAAGTLIIAQPVGGTFGNNATIYVGSTSKATSDSASTQITRFPGGRLEAINYNFTGSSSGQKMYGCDGVNPAFQFDGTSYYPIYTGMVADAPSHISAHLQSLFLSFKGSLQFSSPGSPFSWTVVTGAGELATGDEITGMQPMGASDTGSAMLVFTAGRTHTLYGTGVVNFQLRSTVQDIGYRAYSLSPVGDTVLGLTPRGIQSVQATNAYGDFLFSTISQLVQPLINAKRGLVTAATTLRAKNQYRIYFSDGSAIVIGMTGEKVSGILPLFYGIPVRCICTSTWSNGIERTFFGSDDGYVYEEGVGTSFDGRAIESWIHMAFAHSRSPRTRKRYRRAVLECKVAQYAEVAMSYDFNYGSSEVSPPPAVSSAEMVGTRSMLPDQLPALVGGGNYWDQFTWDRFNWDSGSVTAPSVSLEGTEKNIGIIFYSNRAQDQSHTIEGITIMFSARRIERQ